MLEAYKTVLLPEAESPAHARELLQQFAHTDLPGVIIRNAGTDGVDAAVNRIRDDLPDGVGTEAETTTFEFGDAGEHGHVGFHYDHEVPRVGNEEIPMTYHLTESGVAVASLFAVGPKFMEKAYGHIQDTVEVRAQISENFHAGKVDPDLVASTRYKATLTPGSLLLFKNGAPVWHNFDTIGEGRRSEVYDSWMAVRPGMDIKFNDPATMAGPPSSSSPFAEL